MQRQRQRPLLSKFSQKTNPILSSSSVCIPPMIGITVGLSHNLLIPPLSVFGQPFSPHITNGIICIYRFKVLVYCLFPINPIIFFCMFYYSSSFHLKLILQELFLE